MPKVETCSRSQSVQACLLEQSPCSWGNMCQTRSGECLVLTSANKSGSLFWTCQV